MSLCLSLDSNNNLIPSYVSEDECSSYILLSSQEFNSYKSYNEFLKLPTEQEAQDVFFLIFSSLLVIQFLVYSINKVKQVIKG